MCYSRKVEPSVIEREMQEARNKEEFTDKVETITIKQIVENAKVNSRFGDKILVNINPLHIHIPSWQRMCDVVAVVPGYYLVCYNRERRTLHNPNDYAGFYFSKSK